MYTTTEILKEMLELGMIEKEEYAEMVAEYRNHVRSLMEMDLMAKKAKETIDSIKEHGESKQEETDPKIEKLSDAYLNGHITEEDFRRMLKPKLKPVAKRIKKLTSKQSDKITNNEYMEEQFEIFRNRCEEYANDVMANYISLNLSGSANEKEMLKKMVKLYGNKLEVDIESGNISSEDVEKNKLALEIMVRSLHFFKIK